MSSPATRDVTARTLLAGVVGRPVRHSLSPLIHNAWIQAAGLDAVYLALAPQADGFERLVAGLRGGVAVGVNVTLPYKEEALALADQASQAARRAGAANLMLFRDDGTIEADNTDGHGLMLALAQAGYCASNSPAVVLGAGGAARAAVLALLEAGAPRIALVNRSLDRAQAIAALDPRISAHDWAGAARALDDAAVLINATSLGMEGQPPLELSLEPAPVTAVVMDMVYRPLRTRLLQAAQARGNPTADGLSMLIGQAVPSFAALFGQPPPEIDVRGLCEKALVPRP